MHLLLKAALVFVLISSVLAGEDFYKVLGVKKNANEKEIKKACMSLLLQLKLSFGTLKLTVRSWPGAEQIG